MKYNVKFFKESMPEWKRKKDPILSKIFYRPVSFACASFFANRGIGANAVSNVSTVIGLVACVLFAFPNYVCGILGAILVNIWLILDCTDGNLARSIKAQPFGEFVDAVSSYLLVGLLFNVLGWHTYQMGGCLLNKNIIVLVIGAFASSFDSLMRLVYQKYIVVSREWGIEGKVALDGSNAGKIDKIRFRVEQEIGMGGILPLVILLASVFRMIDLVVILWSIYYGTVFTATVLYLLVKVNRLKNQCENKNINHTDSNIQNS